MREGLLKLEALDSRVLRNHAREQLTQARYVPLAVGKIEQRAAVRFFRILAENLVEAATAREKMERVIEDQERFGEGVDDRERKSLRLC